MKKSIESSSNFYESLLGIETSSVEDRVALLQVPIFTNPY